MATVIRNDYGFDYPFALVQPDSTPLDLTGATVRFKDRPIAGGTLKINAIYTVTDAANGKCKYTFVAADTDTAGTFQAELEATYAAKILTGKLELLVIVPDFV